jgi:hypothetical protein
VSGLSGWPAFRGVSMEVWSQWKPGLLSVFLVRKPVRPYTVCMAFQAKTPHTVYRILYHTSTLM